MTPETEEKLVGDVSYIRGKVEDQSEALDTHGATLSAINYTLNGNGVPGLKQQVAAHEQTLANIKRTFWIVATPVLAALGGGLVTALVWFIKTPH